MLTPWLLAARPKTLAAAIVPVLVGTALAAKGPHPLAYHGLGELFVIAFFGVIAVGGTYYVQRGTLDWPALAMGVAVGLLAVALLAINNLRDARNDVRSGKRTLAVRFGETFAR